jgi:hypothetical protein
MGAGGVATSAVPVHWRRDATDLLTAVQKIAVTGKKEFANR